MSLLNKALAAVNIKETRQGQEQARSDYRRDCLANPFEVGTPQHRGYESEAHKIQMEEWGIA